MHACDRAYVRDWVQNVAVQSPREDGYLKVEEMEMERNKVKRVVMCAHVKGVCKSGAHEDVCICVEQTKRWIMLSTSDTLPKRCCFFSPPPPTSVLCAAIINHLGLQCILPCQIFCGLVPCIVLEPLAIGSNP